MNGTPLPGGSWDETYLADELASDRPPVGLMADSRSGPPDPDPPPIEEQRELAGRIVGYLTPADADTGTSRDGPVALVADVADSREVKGDTSPAALGDVLDDLVGHLTRYVWFPRPEQAIAVALWIAHAHAIDRVEQSPILAITSPVKQSGKSRLLDVIETVVPRPWRIERPSEAVLYRKIERDRPTVLMDEADTVFEDRKGQYEGLRAVFNAGNRRGTFVSRVMPKGKTFDLVDFAIFGPKAIAGIGRFPETIVDRSIVIAMTRRGSGDRIERLRSRSAAAIGAPLNLKLASLLGSLSQDLTLNDIDLPAELDDRGQDNWESFLALARIAGGDWPARAVHAAIALQSDRTTADDNAGVTLLGDLNIIFSDTNEAFLPTSVLLERLHAIDSSPWAEWTGGKPLSARGLAKVLGLFGIKPEKPSPTERGYSRRQFLGEWERFLPMTSRTSATSATTATPSADRPVPVDLWAEASRVFGDDIAGGDA